VKGHLKTNSNVLFSSQKSVPVKTYDRLSQNFHCKIALFTLNYFAWFLVLKTYNTKHDFITNWLKKK